MERLRKRQDFLDLRNGRKANAATLTLQARRRPDGGSEPRAGFTVTKKVGNAVVRNRVRRRLREAMRLVAALHARPGHDYVVVGRRTTLNASFDTILNEMKTAFGRVHGNRPDRRPGAPDLAGEARQ